MLARGLEEIILNKINKLIPKDTLMPGYLIPDIQWPELEAWLFSGPEKMARPLPTGLASPFQASADKFQPREMLNGNPVSAPGKHIENIYPKYKTGKSDKAQALVVLNKTGLPKIRLAWPRLNPWVSMPERLGQP